MSKHPDGDRPTTERKKIKDVDGVEYFKDDIDEHFRRNGLLTPDEQAHSEHFLWEDGGWDVNAIPRRPWLAVPYLMRGHITLLHGPGSNGKSLISLYWAVAVALGRPFGRLRPTGDAARVLLANFEEDSDEQLRRLTAALAFFGAKPSDLAGKLRRISLGKLDPTMFMADADGALREDVPAFDALVWHCRHFSADMVVLDPFIAINAVAENDNTLIRRVMTVLRRQICHDFHAALVLPHHDVKNGGADVDSDQNNARGAGDIINAVRFEAAVRNMSEDQAKKLLPEDGQDQRRYFFRVGSEASKRNITKPDDAEWFERFSAECNGEDVVGCRPWDPPKAFADISVTDANAILDRIGQGMADGALYTDNRKHPATRWAGHILIEEYGRTVQQAERILKIWLKNNVLRIVDFETGNRKQRKGLEVVDANRPG